MQGKTVEVDAVEGRPPKTIDVPDEKGGACRCWHRAPAAGVSMLSRPSSLANPVARRGLLAHDLFDRPVCWGLG